MSQRQSVVFRAPGVVTVETERCPTPEADQVLVQSTLSAISAGTELLVLQGQTPSDLSVDDSLGALTGTGFEFPIRYGYAVVGRVIALGAEVASEWLGRRVFAFNPHQSHFLARPAELLPVPDEVSDADAALLPNMETAVNFLLDAAPLIGERALVFGQGIVGLLTTALLARLPLAACMVVDGYPLRREWALKLGAQVVFDAAAADLVAQIQATLADPRPLYPGVDVVFELSGSPAALQAAIDVAGYDGRVVVGSWYGQKPAALNLGGRFHRSRVRLISSQVSSLTPSLAGRWDKARRMGVAWQMMRELQPSRLVTHRFRVGAAAAAYALLQTNPEQTVQVLLTYEEE